MLNVPVHHSMMKRRLNKQGLFGAVARRQPSLEEMCKNASEQATKRLEQCPMDRWSKFAKLFGIHTRCYVFLKKTMDFSRKRRPTVKYGSGELMIRDYFAATGVNRCSLLSQPAVLLDFRTLFYYIFFFTFVITSQILQNVRLFFEVFPLKSQILV